MKLTPELSQALTNLRSNSDFQKFVSALADDGESLMERLVMMPSGEDVHVVRGQAKQISLVMKAITDAPKHLEQVKNPTRS